MPENKLYRSISDRKLGGVCAGIAEYADISSWIIRILWIIVTIITGGFFGILLYLLMWWLVPEAEEKDPDVIDAEYTINE